MIEDSTGHADPSMKLIACRLPTEPAHEIVKVVVVAPTPPEPVEGGEE